MSDKRVSTKPVVHCWEDGPSCCNQHGACDNPDCETVGSTCMLERGHSGEHEFWADDEITVHFAPFERKPSGKV